MKTYKFIVDMYGGSTGGEIEIKAKDADSAYEKAYDRIGRKLARAFPTLDIDYSVEFAEDYDDGE